MMSRWWPTGESGFALVTTIMLMATTSLLVTGVFLLAFAEKRLGAANVALLHARLAAEAGLASRSSGWPTQDTVAYPFSSQATAGIAGDAGFEVRNIVLGPRFSLVESQGFGPSGRARQLVAEIWEQRPWGIEVRSGLTVREGIPPPGWTDLSGTDSSGTEAGCPPDPGPGPSPTVLVDSTAGLPGDPDFAYLKDRADVALNGGTIAFIGPSYRANGSCDRGDPRNWGDPGDSGRDCTDYLPFVQARGDLKIVGGVAQGILWVEGDLELHGGFEFFGLLIVGGHLTPGESGVRVTGAVVAGSVDSEGFTAGSLSSIVFSTCTVRMALESHLIPRPLRQRAWAGPF